MQYARVKVDKNVGVDVMHVNGSGVGVGNGKTELAGKEAGPNGLTITESHLMDIPVGPVISKPNTSNITNRRKKPIEKVNKAENKVMTESKIVRKKGVVELASNSVSKRIR